MYEILIDEHRHIYGAVKVLATLTDEQKADKRARLDHYRAQCVAAGHTPRVHSQATLPAGFAVGRVLSADGTTAAHPPDTHQPNIIRDRRDAVVRWAMDNTKLSFMLLALQEVNASRNTRPESVDLAAGRPPYGSAIYLAFVRSTLAAAHADANVLSATVWEALKHNIKFDRHAMLGLSVSNWKNRFARMDAYTVFVKAGATLAVGPTEVALATAVDQYAKDWVSGLLYGARR